MPEKRCVKCCRMRPISQFIGKFKQTTLTCRFCRKKPVKLKKIQKQTELESKPDCLMYDRCMSNAAYLNINRDVMGCHDCNKYQPSPELRITELPTGSELSGSWVGWAKNKMGSRL